jgi:hypothetical protein
VSLGVGALSYDGRFNVAMVADRETYPDLDVFVTGAREALRALAAGTRTDGLALAGGPPTAHGTHAPRRPDAPPRRSVPPRRGPAG